MDCAINGVINLYVVQRKISDATVETELGKDAIFLDGYAWVSRVSYCLSSRVTYEVY